MFKSIAILAVILSLLNYSCSNPSKSAYTETQVIAVVDSLMAAQEKAWNSADIDGFMSSYWNSDSLSFIGSSGLNKGWSKTLSNYKRSYPDAAAMGKLVFKNLDYELLADSVFQVIGSWTLFREADTLGGYYSLIWQIKAGEWKITSDHSS